MFDDVRFEDGYNSSGFTIDEIEPRLFSFNNPYGACPACDGLGTELKFEPDLVVPDSSLSLRDGAVVPWAKTGNTSPYYNQTLEALAKHFKFSMSTPWRASAAACSLSGFRVRPRRANPLPCSACATAPP